MGMPAARWGGRRPGGSRELRFTGGGTAHTWDDSGRFTSINGAVQPTLTGIQA